MGKQRVDSLLVERGVVESREKARALVLAGAVQAEGRVVAKPGSLVPAEASLSLKADLPYVSRGGFKLAHALDTFALDVAGLVALDVGASTGGFTDCLLQRRARRVYALDVGRGQLAWPLRQDPRVAVMEGINARYPFDLPEAVDLATVDVSFISVAKVLPSVSQRVKPGGKVIVLLKPQFEAGRRQVGRGGYVRDPQVHAQVLGGFIAWSLEQGFRLRGLTPSPVLAPSGNQEFLLLLEL